MVAAQTSENRLEEIRLPIRRELALASGLMILSSLLWLVQAACIAHIFSALAAGSSELSWLIGATVVFLLLGLIRAALTFTASGRAFAAADRQVDHLRLELVIRQSMLSPLSRSRYDSAEFTALVSDKLNAFYPYLTHYEPALRRAITIPAIIAMVAFFHAWAIGLILLLTGPLIPVFMALIGMNAQKASEQQMQEIGNLNSLAIERIRAMADIRLLAAREIAVRHFSEAANKLRKRSMAVLQIAFLSSAALELFSAIGVAFVAVFVGFTLLGELNFGAYGTPLTLYEGIFLLLLAPEFYQPLRDLAAAWHDKTNARAVALEIAELESTETRNILGTGSATRPQYKTLSAIGRSLEWKTDTGNHIRFPDFRIQSGENIAIIGKSGSGKTTLLSLLAGLAPVTRGELIVNGKVLNNGNADDWRANLAWIGQFPHFINASLRANLCLGRPDCSPRELFEALNLASAEHIVDRLPQGIDTRLGETGHGVSGGEARRFTIARAILSDAKLILADEPTADLDRETAKAVIDGLVTLSRRGSTLVIATHDNNLVERMDRTISLDNAP
jgi:ATP-binding cassette, subfamily C, bacterial CydD